MSNIMKLLQKCYFYVKRNENICFFIFCTSIPSDLFAYIYIYIYIYIFKYTSLQCVKGGLL